MSKWLGKKTQVRLCLNAFNSQLSKIANRMSLKLIMFLIISLNHGMSTLVCVMHVSLQAISETFSKTTEKTEYDEEFTHLEKGCCDGNGFVVEIGFIDLSIC